MRRGPSPRPSPARDQRVEARRREIAGEEHIYGHEVGVFCMCLYISHWLWFKASLLAFLVIFLTMSRKVRHIPANNPEKAKKREMELKFTRIVQLKHIDTNFELVRINKQ